MSQINQNSDTSQNECKGLDICEDKLRWNLLKKRLIEYEKDFANNLEQVSAVSAYINCCSFHITLGLMNELEGQSIKDWDEYINNQEERDESSKK